MTVLNCVRFGHGYNGDTFLEHVHHLKIYISSSVYFRKITKYMFGNKKGAGRFHFRRAETVLTFI